MLGFDWGTDMSAAAQSIRENLQTTFLPLETDRPLILRYDPSLDPFMRLALSVDSEAEVDLGEKRLDGEVALFALRELAEPPPHDLEAEPLRAEPGDDGTIPGYERDEVEAALARVQTVASPPSL